MKVGKVFSNLETYPQICNLILDDNFGLNLYNILLSII